MRIMQAITTNMHYEAGALNKKLTNNIDKTKLHMSSLLNKIAQHNKLNHKNS